MCKAKTRTGTRCKNLPENGYCHVHSKTKHTIGGVRVPKKMQIRERTKSCRHKGTEPSPKGRGFCAHDMEVGYMLFGTDKNVWKVTQDRNGRKRWVKARVQDSVKKVIYSSLFSV